MMKRLAPVLAEPPPTWSAAPLPPEKRRDVLTSDGLHDDNPLRQLTSGEALVSPRDDANYGRALAQELAPLACGLDDKDVAARFVLRWNCWAASL